MRDGAELNTILIVPKGIRNAPILLDRTPYSADKAVTRGGGGPRLRKALSPAYAELAQAGYIIVVQDVRGKFASQGDYVMNRPLRGALNGTGVDHATDAFDTIAWLTRNVGESNGRVGLIGTSYAGFTALIGLVDPHPALRAVVPINPMVDAWKGDDWFHNGAFRQQMMRYIYRQTASRNLSESWPFEHPDDYEVFLRYGSASAVARAAGMEKLPAWLNLVEHPAYDAFWQEQALDKVLARQPRRVPTLLVHSLWDQEDIYGAPAVFDALKNRRGGDVHLVIGPWHHGQANGDGTKLGVLNWGSDTSQWFRQNRLIPFLDAHLKTRGRDVRLPKVTAFETGTAKWRTYDDWPRSCAARCGFRMTRLYLAPHGSLSFTRPTAGARAYDEYVSDPAAPVSYRTRPIPSPWANGSTWRQWLVDDQRFAATRPDVLTYTSATLTRPIRIAGAPVAHLFASTSGTDSDWVVKVIDVYPDEGTEKPELRGYQLPISMDILRARYRNDPTRLSKVTSGEPRKYTIVLPHTNHVFRPGHRIMIQVQSSWFPLYDRNPQRFIPNIFLAQPGDFVKARQRVYRERVRQSFIALPIIP